MLFNDSYNLSSAPPFDLSKSANETVFIAANIIDGDLISGAWGDSLLELVERIGKDRVWVSVYGGPVDALRGLEERLAGSGGVGVERERVWCVSEEEEKVDLESVGRTVLPTGERRVKRIAWLAEVRNKVLEPLYKGAMLKPDKLLFLNDIYFTPSSALRLLWGTNLDATGVARYKAVCAVDFVRSWKFYDTFATRDVEGYSIGVPLFPWFVADGEGRSRRDVLEGRDAVRVRSCWGGMVAFEGRWFWGGGMSADVHPPAQNAPKKPAQKANEIAKLKAAKANNGIGVPSLPLRFRSEPEPFWDSSECCLIHADIMALPDSDSVLTTSGKGKGKSEEGDGDGWDTGIYMNPYVRTSYSASTHRYIWLAKRFERLFSPVQRVLNYWADMPRWNYRRTEKEGQNVKDRLWISVHSNLTEEEAVRRAEEGWGFDDDDDDGEGEKQGVKNERGLERRETLGKVRGKEYWGTEGYYVDYERTAKRGGYCGVRQLLVMKEGQLGDGEGNWDNLLDRVPPVDI